MIRVRFAPSPTGELHIGGARTALYNYLFAKQKQGKFILRLEDTDKERYVKGSEKRLLEDLNWLGINWDEGPDQGGKFKPYIQSQRLDIYKKYVGQLLTSQQAYYCFCSSARLEELRQQQQLAKMPSKYDRYCLTKSEMEIKQLLNKKTPYVIRLKIPEGQTTFTDLIHSQITVDNNNIDDQILIKSDGFPTYHLANVVDDHLMEISHVIRGEEWLPSTPKHIILYQTFGWAEPVWIHLPNVLNKNRAKLSKRKDGEVVWLSTYIKRGYLPRALINFLALLGWHPQDNQELFDFEQLIDKFNLERVQKAGAIFDLDKLNWFNAKYIRLLPTDQLDKLLADFYPKTKYITGELTKLLQSRLTTLAEAPLLGDFYFSDKLSFAATLLIPPGSNPQAAVAGLRQGIEVLTKVTDWNLNNMKSNLLNLIEEKRLNKKDLLWPIRVALTGKEQSPDVYEVLVALGKKRSLTRIKQALELLTTKL